MWRLSLTRIAAAVQAEQHRAMVAGGVHLERAAERSRHARAPTHGQGAEVKAAAALEGGMRAQGRATVQSRREAKKVLLSLLTAPRYPPSSADRRTTPIQLWPARLCELSSRAPSSAQLTGVLNTQAKPFPSPLRQKT